MSTYASADIVDSFRNQLKLCKLTKGETVLIFTDPRYVRPEYVPAAFAAAKTLGAEAYVMISQGDQLLEDNLVCSAWNNADLVLGMSMLPRGIGSWIYTETSNNALKAGARILMVQEPFDGLKRMFPNEIIRRRGLIGAQMMEEAKEIRITSASGSDYVMRKDGRKGAYQCGIADEPGRWDHWPSGMVYCAPKEDSAEGIYVIEPGDVLLGLWRHATTKVKITLEKGRIKKIEGGSDAYLLQDYLDTHGDDGAYRLSHAGWGTDERADWGAVGMDSESKYGTVLVAIGRNILDAPAKYCGMAGENWSTAHCDICCRNTSLWLDGKQILENEKFLIPDLR